jgi:putative flippase GtrA
VRADAENRTVSARHESGSTIAPRLCVPLPRPLVRLARLGRAALAGGVATLVDLAVLALLVSVAHLPPRVANVPALVAGGVVSFVGNRHFAFRAKAGSLAKQAVLFTAIELVTLTLNGVLFDLAMRGLEAHPGWYAPVRLVTSHVVFLAWSYPLWRLVFRVPSPREAV